MSTFGKSGKPMLEIGAGLYVHQLYDPDQLPPDWQAAKRHGQACLPGFIEVNRETRTLCSCCHNQIQKNPIPYCENMKQMAYLGAGFPLFYNFLKFCIIMLAALLADDCILSAYYNFQQNDCKRSNPYCVQGVANSLSFIASVPISDSRYIIAVTSFIVQLVLLGMMRMTQNALTVYYDERTCKISDFTLKVKFIPRGYKNNKKRISDMIKSKCPEVNVMSILLIYDSDQFEKKLKELHKVSNLRAQQRKFNPLEDGIMIKILNSQYDQFAAEIAEIAKNFDQDQGDYFTGIAFVTFNTKNQKDIAVKGISELTSEEISVHYPPVTNGAMPRKVVARPARQPNQINWQNIHKPKKTRTLALIKGWLLSTLFLVAITIVFFFLIKARSHYIQQSANVRDAAHDIGIFLGYFTIFMIVMVNKFLFPPVCHWLTHLQLHTNFNQQQFSFALKYMLAVFFTTALMTMAVEAVVYHNFYGLFGVVQAESYMFVLNAFIPPLVWGINPFYLVAEYKKKRNMDRQDITQKQANKLMEYPHYSMGKRYAEVIKTMWFTFLYAWIIPLGAVFSLFGLICYYFVDKYVLLRKSSLQVSISSHLSDLMLFLLDFTILLKPMGEIFFDYNLRKKVLDTSIIMSIVATIYILLPKNKILRCLFPEKQMDYRFTYEEMKDAFINTYENVYPLNQSRRLSSKVGIILSQKTNKSQGSINNTIITQKQDQTQGSFAQNLGQDSSIQYQTGSTRKSEISESFSETERPIDQLPEEQPLTRTYSLSHHFYDPRLLPFMPNMNPNYGRVSVTNHYTHENTPYGQHY